MEVEGSKVEGVRVIDRVFIGFDRNNTVLTLLKINYCGIFKSTNHFKFSLSSTTCIILPLKDYITK